ncbi:hypothetical protein [Rhizobium ruizarguesonis]|uniref:hypothetical protein n=1 Tax=Rhizobium ruizarguesonis TaxID=2081791 RepID=UPI001031B27E|nr:hypothetical protein [Rhizobium ruizarguesonis]TAV04570.1 hypothetical protein ELI39_04315 [Rhizobium ruizarguesonis]
MDDMNDLAKRVADTVARARQARVVLENVRRHIALETPADDAVLKLKDALFLPVLGGVMRTNGRHTPSPTFTKASLELAIRKGQLKPTWKHGKLCVRHADVKAWAALSEKEATQPSIRLVYDATEHKTNRDKQQAISSQEQLKRQLAALKAAQKKGRK